MRGSQRARALLVGVVAMIGAPAVGWSSAMAQTASVITSAPPPLGVAGNGYLHQFTVSPPLPDTTFSVTAGTLPPGLDLSPVGFLTGAPLAAGTFGPTTVCATRLLAAPACQTFTIVILKRAPGILAAPSPGGPVGTPVRESAFLVGAFTPTGFVLFRLFSDPACTVQLFSSTNAVTVAGSAVSDDFAPPGPGVYRWTTAYSGDVNNAPAATPCDPSNSVTITGSPLSTTTTTPPTTTSTSTTTATSTTSTTSTSVPPWTTSTVMPSTTSSTTAPTSTTTTAPPATTTTTRAPVPTTTPQPVSTPPTIQVIPAQTAREQNFRIWGYGYPAGIDLRAELTSTPLLLGATTTDAGGGFLMVVALPATTPPGLHTVRVSVRGGGPAAQTTLRVT